MLTRILEPLLSPLSLWSGHAKSPKSLFKNTEPPAAVAVARWFSVHCPSRCGWVLAGAARADGFPAQEPVIKAPPVTGQASRVCNRTRFVQWMAGVLLLPLLLVSGLAQAAITGPASSSNGSYTISWTAVPGATRTSVTESKDGATATSVSRASSGSRAFTGKAAGTYVYTQVAYRTYRPRPGGPEHFETRARGRLSSQEFPLATYTHRVVVTSGIATPGAISGPASDADGAYSLSWGAVSGASRYTLQRQTDGGGWTTIQDISSRSRWERGLGNASYGYRVRACNSDGICSGWTATRTVRVAKVPGAPSGVWVPEHDIDGIYRAVWSNVAGATRYELQRRVAGGRWATVQDSPALGKSESGLGTGRYDYRLRACAAAGCSAYTAIDTIAVTIAPGVPPSIEVSSIAGSNSVYTVSWGVSYGSATGYELYQQKDGGDFTLLYSGSGTSATGQTVMGSRYLYRVRAYQRVGSYSSFSGYRTSTAVTSAVAAPVPVVPARDGDGAYDVTWASVAGASRYELQRRVAGGRWATVLKAPALVKSESGLGSGRYDYRLRACAAAGCSGYSAISSTTVQAPAAAPSAHVEPSPGIDSAAVRETDRIGATAGSFRVDESGSATYRIPIATAAGTAGVAPQLSLNYSSQGGNGLLGLGWQIGGLSGITRSRQTLQQDGKAMPITWTADDRFALDGQRLILVSGTYGAPNSEYRTEIDSFARIHAKGGSAGHPAYWEVRRKDGSISYYGNSADSRQQNGDNQTLTWALNQFTDSVGNPIWFIYESTGGHSIREVRYAYGSANGPGGYHARVVFTYQQNRDDPIGGYVAGHRFTTSKRLSSVTSYNGSTALRTYNLGYRPFTRETITQTVPIPPVPSLNRPGGEYTYSYTVEDTDHLSRLASLQECVGSSCLPATEFDWSLPSLGFERTASDRLTFGLGRKDYVADYRPADINGDGRQDLVWLEATTNKRGKIIRHALFYALADDNGGFHNRMTAYQDRELAGPVNGPDGYRFEVLDYNADGRMDLLLWNNNDHQPGRNSEWKLFLSKPRAGGNWELKPGPATGLPAMDDLQFLDHNSDGLADAVYLDNGALYARYLEVDPSQPGSSDHYYKFGAAQQLMSSAELETIEFWKATLTPRELLGAHTDINGDGQVDILIRSRGTYQPLSFKPHQTRPSIDIDHLYLVIREGATHRLVRLNDPESYVRDDKMRFALRWADLNGDGLPDQLYYGVHPDSQGDHQAGWYYRLNTGEQPAPAIVAPGTLEEWQNPPAVGNWLSDPVLVLGMSAHPTGYSQKKDRIDLAGRKQQVQLLDYNRDGYPDFVWHDQGSRLKVRYWDNKAQGFKAAVDLKTTPTFAKDKHTHALMDVNSDGIPDHVFLDYAYGSSASNLQLTLSSQQHVPANRITRITNGLGAATEIQYGTLASSGHYQRVNVETTTTTTTYTGPCFRFSYFSSTLPTNTEQCTYRFNITNADDFYSVLNGEWDLQDDAHTLGKDVNSDQKRDPVLEINGAMYVVTNVSSSAPAAGTSPGQVDNNATSSISYYYGEAKVQAMGRGFLGFQRLSTVDEQTGVTTTTTYRQDFPFIGSPLKTVVTTGDGHTLSESENIWKLKHWDSGSQSHTDWSGSGIPATKLYAPYLARSIEQTYNLADNGASQGNQLQTVTTDNVYDGYGNPTRITVTTDDETGGDRFVKATRNTYGASTWDRAMGRLSRTEVTSTRTDSRGAQSAVRTSAFSYYPSGDKKGLLHTEVIEPDNSQYSLTTSYRYDQFGNKIKATTSGRGVTSRYSRSEYDPLGRYVERSYNSLEQQTSQVIARNAYGQVTRARDLNGLDVYSAYSPMGRKVFERAETGGFSKTTLTDDNLGFCPAGSAYKATSESAGGGESQQCFDKLGRATRNLTRSFDGRWVASDVEFDNLGRSRRQSEPYYLTNLAGAVIASPTRYWTTIDYDLLGRPVRTTLPDHSRWPDGIQRL